MHWQPITDEHPKPLEDVLVSVFNPSVLDEPLVYQAYRRHTNPSQFVITGTADGVLGHVYAWAPVPPAAPLPEATNPQPGSPRITCAVCGDPIDNIRSPLCSECAAEVARL